jgi:hypothetical protein
MYFAEKKILSARFTAIFAAASRMVIRRGTAANIKPD